MDEGVRRNAQLPTPALGQATRTLVFGALALVSVAAFVVDISPAPHRAYDLLYLLVVWGAAAAAWTATVRAPSHLRLVPSLIATGITTSSLGDLI